MTFLFEMPIKLIIFAERQAIQPIENHNEFGTHGVINYAGQMMFFKIQNRSMITSIMDNYGLFFRMHSIKAQTRLQRLRTILP